MLKMWWDEIGTLSLYGEALHSWFCTDCWIVGGRSDSCLTALLVSGGWMANWGGGWVNERAPSVSGCDWASGADKRMWRTLESYTSCCSGQRFWWRQNPSDGSDQPTTGTRQCCSKVIRPWLNLSFLLMRQTQFHKYFHRLIPDEELPN